MAKRRVGKYPKAFRKMAVERLKGCDNIVALSEELGGHRRLLLRCGRSHEKTRTGTREHAGAGASGPGSVPHRIEIWGRDNYYRLCPLDYRTRHVFSRSPSQYAQCCLRRKQDILINDLICIYSRLSTLVSRLLKDRDAHAFIVDFIKSSASSS